MRWFPLPALLLLAGCSNNPYPEGDHARSVYYGSIGEDPKTLDPTFAYDVLSASIVDPIYECLLQYSYLRRPYQLEPALAERMPERETYLYVGPETGGKAARREAYRYTFHLRRGLRFQDDPCFEATGGKGREVRSDDVLYALKRTADPTVSCPVISIFAEKIAGLAAFYGRNRNLTLKQAAEGEPQRADLTGDVSGLRRLGDYTFEVSLTEKYPQFLYWMAMHFTAPIPHEAVEFYGADFKNHPVGTGAYLLKEYKKGQRIILARNPNARHETYPSEGDPGDRARGLLEDAGKALPLIEECVFTTVKESIPRWNLFLQGYMDASGVPREAFDRVITESGRLSERMARRGILLDRAKDLATGYFAFNMDDPLLGTNRKLRQAVSCAIHTAEYVELYENGLGEVAQSPLPPGIFGHDPSYRNPYRQHNLRQAKRLLAEAGFPKGLTPQGQPLTLNYDTSGTSAAGRQVDRWLIRQFETLGIRLNVITNDWSTQQRKADSGNFQLIRYGWVADYPDPENFLFLLISANERPGVNVANYKNPVYDALFEQMKGLGNDGEEGERRLALIRRMVKVLEEDCPWVPHFHSEGYSLFHQWFHNVKLHGIAYNLLKYKRVDPEARAGLREKWNQPRLWPVVLALAALVAVILPAIWSVRARRR
jgi:ABC-type transport system substrate-binding protein